MNVSARGLRFLPPEGTEGQPRTARGSKGVAAFVIASVVLLAAFVFILPYSPHPLTGSHFSHLTTSEQAGNGTSTTTGLNFNLYNPLILGGSANVSYPSDYNSLAAYAVDQINQDRSGFNLSPVALSTSPAGQQHADSMLRYGYFSHFDTQGFKPYMRHTLLGGKGAVEENVAYIFNSPPHFTTTSSVENAIQILEHSMMYNDSVCCNNGHRDNILTGLHNRVSIGVAYNETSVYFVEDFENYYIDLNLAVSSSYGVSMTGTPIMVRTAPSSIFITYDATPSAETPTELNNGPREYGPGTIIGGVLPSCSPVNCPAFQKGITVYADTWVYTSTQVNIAFSLHDFVQNYGAGVYNVYLITGNNTASAITSTSVFITSA